MATEDNNVSSNNAINDVESGVNVNSTFSSQPTKRASAMGNNAEYRPLNSLDTELGNGQPQRTVFGINRKALISFVAVAVVALTVIVLTVVFVVNNGMFD